MKRYKKNCNTFLILSLLVVMTGCKTSEETIARMHESYETNRFSFEATSATPMGRGRSINLSSYYSVKVSNDTIDAYLPYFGVAYTAPHPGEDGGIKFVSTDFELTKSNKKNGTWTIAVKTNDTRKSYELMFDISESGYATLIVRERDRQAISFRGKIE